MKAVGSFRLRVRKLRSLMSSLMLKVFKEKMKECFPVSASQYSRLLVLVDQICCFPKLIVHQGNRERVFDKKADVFYKTRLVMRGKMGHHQEGLLLIPCTGLGFSGNYDLLSIRLLWKS